MSPYQSTQSRAHTPKGSSDFNSNPISRRSKSDSEISLTANDGGNVELGYDMSRFNDHIKPNLFSYYEIKSNHTYAIF